MEKAIKGCYACPLWAIGPYTGKHFCRHPKFMGTRPDVEQYINDKEGTPDICPLRTEQLILSLTVNANING